MNIVVMQDVFVKVSKISVKASTMQQVRRKARRISRRRPLIQKGLCCNMGMGWREQYNHGTSIIQPMFDTIGTDTVFLPLASARESLSKFTMCFETRSSPYERQLCKLSLNATLMPKIILPFHKHTAATIRECEFNTSVGHCSESIFQGLG